MVFFGIPFSFRCVKEVSLYILSALFIFAGIMHFIKPRMYLMMMPPWLPAHAAMNYISGAAEIVLGGLLLWPASSIWAAWGLIALLVAVFPANVYMLTSGRFKIPRLLLILRLPLQAVLIAWVYWHT